MTASLCLHAACTCAVEPEHQYCSEACHLAAGLPTKNLPGCPCGHQGCEGSTPPARGRPLAEGKPSVPGPGAGSTR